MKKGIIISIGCAIAVLIGIVFICATTGDKLMTKEKGVYIVNSNVKAGVKYYQKHKR